MSRFILDIPSFLWEIVLGRKEQGSCHLRSTNPFRTNSLLCLHRLMIFLFIQVCSYSMLRRATRWRVVNRGRGKLPFPPFLSASPLVLSSEVDASCIGSSIRIHIMRLFIPIGHSASNILLSSIHCDLSIFFTFVSLSLSSSHMFFHIRVESSTLTRFFFPDVGNCFETRS